MSRTERKRNRGGQPDAGEGRRHDRGRWKEPKPSRGDDERPRLGVERARGGEGSQHASLEFGEALDQGARAIASLQDLLRSVTGSVFVMLDATTPAIKAAGRAPAAARTRS